MSAFGVVLTVIITISALFMIFTVLMQSSNCLLYTSPSPRY